MPSIYDYFCFLQFLPTAAMGPSLQYSEYTNYIEMKNQYVNIPDRLPVVWRTFK